MNLYSNLANLINECNRIPYNEYEALGISKGLRKSDNSGILVGITSICNNYGSRDGKACEGRIIYRGIDIQDLITDKNVGYEGIVYLLLFGQLPTQEQLEEFSAEIRRIRMDATDELEQIIDKETGHNIMNIMARCVLNLYDYDQLPDDISQENMVKQVLKIIALIPVISINAYRRKVLKENEVFKIIEDSGLSVAENILYMLHGDNYTLLDAKILDLCLILHTELGGGNNSAFTTQVVASTGTDTYSTIASAICSIKGPKHGGANIKTFLMFKDMENVLENWEDEEAIKKYLQKIIKREAFDQSGLIYGVGHAVFTLSDPRTEIMRDLAHTLADGKGRKEEFALYERVEKLAPEILRQEKNIQKPICANVDYYSGFIYDMLGIPVELFTPMFVNARIAGWGAHRLEEMCNGAKIIHPAFHYIQGEGINKNVKGDL